MIACAHVAHCSPKNQTTLFIGFQVEILKDDNTTAFFTADAEVAASSSATQINTAIKNAIVAKAAEFGAAGLSTAQVFIFGAA